MSYIRSVWDGSDILVVLARDGAVEDSTEVVVDVDEGGDVLGIELLGLFARHPELTVVEEWGAARSVSVDEEADALYVRFAHGRSVEQLVRPATISIGADGRLTSVRVRMRNVPEDGVG